MTTIRISTTSNSQNNQQSWISWRACPSRGGYFSRGPAFWYLKGSWGMEISKEDAELRLSSVRTGTGSLVVATETAVTLTGVTPVTGSHVYYQRLRNLGMKSERASGWLVRDPNNSHDKNAVTVWDLSQGTILGHLPRYLAATWGPTLDEARICGLLCELRFILPEQGLPMAEVTDIFPSILTVKR